MDVDDVSASNKDQELNIGLRLDKRPISDSTDTVQSTEEATTILPPSTPSRAIIRADSHIVSGESSGFSDNPVYPLNSAAPSSTISSHYNVTIKEAPSFATNPAYPLKYMAPRADICFTPRGNQRRGTELFNWPNTSTELHVNSKRSLNRNSTLTARLNEKPFLEDPIAVRLTNATTTIQGCMVSLIKAGLVAKQWRHKRMD